MIGKKKTKDTPQENYLDRIPVKNIEWEKDEKDHVYLLKEKSKKKLMKKLIDLFGKSQFFRIHLDELGTSTWMLIDGKRSIYDISNSLKEQFGEKIEPAEQRVAAFIAMLKKNGFITFN